MSQRNVDMVGQAYVALNDGDWEALFDSAHPDFEMTLARGPEAGTHRGPEAVKALIEDQRAAFEVWRIKPEEFIEQDDQVVAFIALTLRPKASSAEFQIRIANLWTLRDGKLVSMHGFPEREKALEAAGITE
jgi:ketosteroid isomerase-like protein